jgi:hypothetical protein
MQQKRGHVAVTPNCVFGSEGVAGNKVCFVGIRLGELGLGLPAVTTSGNPQEGGNPTTATTCSSGAGSPSRTNVGLAGQVGELISGGLAAHARESPSAPTANKSFGLGFCECFEFDHLVHEMNVMGVAQPVSTGVLSNWLFFSSNAATRTFLYFLFAKFYFSQPSSCRLLHRLCCLSVYLFFRPLNFCFFQRRFLAFLTFRS